MQCPNHSRAETIGYCCVCGGFGCAECLTTHEGNLYCQRHYRPISQKIEEDKRHELLRKQRPRQLLAVRHADGRCQYGVCYALNLRDHVFHLDLVDSSGAPLGKTETRVVVLAERSRTKTSLTPLVSPFTRVASSEENAT